MIGIAANNAAMNFRLIAPAIDLHSQRLIRS
jgi:hypothetical protein